VLVDEADKMHYVICQNFLGIFDKGEFELPNGMESDPNLTYSKYTDFRQTIFLLTSNAGEAERRDQLDKHPMGFAPAPSTEAKHELSEEVIKKALKQKFSPEFTERIDLFLSYKPLTVDVAEGIARREIDKLKNGFVKRRTGNSVAIDVRPETVASLAKAGLDPLRGARNFNRFVEDQLISPLRNVFLSGQLS
jgi:ATP-dependent Clp protease ATP-binding subunit ClpB